jgi:hypothetical protein
MSGILRLLNFESVGGSLLYVKCNTVVVPTPGRRDGHGKAGGAHSAKMKVRRKLGEVRRRSGEGRRGRKRGLTSRYEISFCKSWTSDEKPTL